MTDEELVNMKRRVYQYEQAEQKVRSLEVVLKKYQAEDAWAQLVPNSLIGLDTAHKTPIKNLIIDYLRKEIEAAKKRMVEA